MTTSDEPTPPLHIIGRVAYLRASGRDWPEIAEELARTKTETESYSRHPDWLRLYRLATRTVRQEAEAEARMQRRLALRSADDAEATSAAEEAYRLRGTKKPRRISELDASTRESLIRSYFDCLNAMSVEEFQALEASVKAESNVTPA